MNTNYRNSELKVNEISERFQTNLTQFEQFLSSNEDEKLKAIHKKLCQDLDDYYQNGILTIAFIGQYSAGKSTIISALTGRRDIYIDADIATDTTTLYDWNGIRIIDTPGLYTDRTEHDQITYDVIEKADLLVFCLTNNLFDNITADNFKKLAYDREYSGKMMLVINKMSQESGEQQELIENYKETLAKTLEPYALEHFPLSFIDAKDYCEGIDEEDELLTEMSGFSEFIQPLNQFIQKKQIMARLDTPVRITLSKLNDTELALQRNDTEDSAYLKLVNRCARRVEEERKRFHTEVKKIALELYSKVSKEATPLVDAVGSIDNEKEWEKLDEQAEKNIDQHCNIGQKKLEKIANEVQFYLMENLKELLDDELTQLLIQRLEKEAEVSSKRKTNQATKQGYADQLNSIRNFAEFVADPLYKAAKNPIPLVGKNGFLKAGNVIGGDLHKGVYQVGKFLGIKFKPFGAVNVAKNIGNAARVVKFAGPALAVAGLAFDLKASHDEDKESEKLSQARKEINSQFTELAQQLKTQLESIGREVEKQIYDETADKIEQMREAHNQTISENQEQMQELNTLRQQFREILSEIDQSFR